MIRTGLAAVLMLSAGAAAAAPRVVADIAPVHSLVARVMQGVGEPALILPPGASPHGYALRPSEARRLQDAELVFWIGPELTPWLDGPIDALAGRAAAVSLRAVPGVTLLPVRQGAAFEAHEGAHGDDDHGEEAAGHGHDHAAEAKAGTRERDDGRDHAGEAKAAAHDHDHDHDHADRAAAEAHDHDHDHDHDHAHGATDEHIWLDPENAKAWLSAIAAALSEADPANAGAYFANAKAGKAELDALTAELDTALAPARGRGFVVFHDAYQYFEARFGAPAAGSITVSDAAAPSAARVAEIRALLKEIGAGCVFAEPQFPARIVETVAEGTGARTGVLDPLGASLTPGPGLYGDVLRGMAASLVACLAS
jgi:zinc transport system substrate-binding protein